MKKNPVVCFFLSVVLLSLFGFGVNADVQKANKIKPSTPQSSGKTTPPQGYEKPTWQTHCNSALSAAASVGHPPGASSFYLQSHGCVCEWDVEFNYTQGIGKVWGLLCHNNPMTVIVLEDATQTKRGDVLVGQNVDLTSL